MFAGAAMTETGGNKIIFLKREKAVRRMEGVSPVYQKKHVKLYVFLVSIIEFLSREISQNQLSNSIKFTIIIRNLF
jgi:hypothetical protein